MKFTGKVTISRRSGGDKESISIELEDAASGCRITEFEMSMADFARAVTGFGYQPCSGTVLLNSPIGKKRESKRENIFRPDPKRWGDEAEKKRIAKRAIAPFEKDGWEGRAEDLWNHHKRQKDGSYSVVFIRFVDAPAIEKGGATI